MPNKKFGYIRVSTKEQNLARQYDALIKAGVPKENIIEDKETGLTLDRAGYSYLKTLLREGDVLVILDLDRLSRRKADILHELQYFREHQIQLQIVNIPTTCIEFNGNDKTQPMIMEMVNNILIEVLSYLAEQEYRTRKRRQEEGIKAAKDRGVYTGRPRKPNPENFTDIYLSWRRGEISIADAQRLTGFSSSSFYLRAKEQEEILSKANLLPPAHPIKVGRPAKPFPDNWKEIYNQYKKGEIGVTEASRRISVSTTTFYRMVKQYEENQMTTKGE